MPLKNAKDRQKNGFFEVAVMGVNNANFPGKIFCLKSPQPLKTTKIIIITSSS